MAKKKRAMLDMISTIRVRLTYVCTEVVFHTGEVTIPCPMWVLKGIGALGDGGITPRHFWLPSVGETAFLTEEEMELVAEIAEHNHIDLFVDEDDALHLADSPDKWERSVGMQEWLDQQEKRWTKHREERL